MLTYPDRPLLASHPVYPYLARRYGLNLMSVTWEPDKVPSAEQWSELEGVLRERPAGWMVWEDEPTEKSAVRLRALGVASIVLNPCANRPERGDFLSVMPDNARSPKQVFQIVAKADSNPRNLPSTPPVGEEAP